METKLQYTKGKWYPTMVAGERRIVAEQEDSEEVICYGVRHYNIYLIVAAVNACIAINPDNPQAVAESIKDMYEALRRIWVLTATKCHEKQSKVINDLSSKALAKAEG